MPRPPILPTIDWEKVFNTGQSYTDWLKVAENPDNAEKMETLRQQQTLAPEAVAALEGLSRPVHVIAIAEAWCGDVIRHVPVLEKMAEATPQLRTRYIAREQYPDVFARFLTNGGEAIPKFVFLSDQFVECGNWGPMPEACRKFIARGKACGDVGAARKRVSERYEADSERREVVDELLHLAEIAASTLEGLSA